MYKKRKNAYMTLEASLVIPLIVGGIIFLLFLGFYLYNACVIKQAVYVAALRGSQLTNVTSDEVEAYVQQQLENLMGNQILARENMEKEISVSIGKVKVRISSHMQMPLTEWISSVTNLWSIESKAEASRINPVDIIRNVRKINGSQISK